MFDYTPIQNKVGVIIEKFGFAVTLSKPVDGNAKTYGLWGKSKEDDVSNGVSSVIQQQKEMYLSGSVKKLPEVGDTLITGTDRWIINEVEVIKPARYPIAYKLKVSG